MWQLIIQLSPSNKDTPMAKQLCPYQRGGLRWEGVLLTFMVLAGKNLCSFWKGVLPRECPLRQGPLYVDILYFYCALCEAKNLGIGMVVWIVFQCWQALCSTNSSLSTFVISILFAERMHNVYYCPIGHKDNNGLSRQVIFHERFSCIEMFEPLPGVCGPSRQMICHDWSLKRVLLYNFCV